jgi:hypothetical protein
LGTLSAIRHCPNIIKVTGDETANPAQELRAHGNSRGAHVFGGFG